MKIVGPIISHAERIKFEHIAKNYTSRSTVSFQICHKSLKIMHLGSAAENGIYSVSQKKSPLRTCGNFSKRDGNFSTKFYMPIVRSYPR